MAEAAGAIRDNRLRDAVRYSRALVSRGPTVAGQCGRGRDRQGHRRSAAAARGSAGRARSGPAALVTRPIRRSSARSVWRARAESMQERTRERAQANGREHRAKTASRAQGRVSRGKRARASKAKAAGPERSGPAGQQGQGQQGQGQGQGQQGQGGQQGQVRTARAAVTADAATGARRRLHRRPRSRRRAGRRWRLGRLVERWPVRLTPEDIRQLRGEARQFSQDAQALRGMLRGENIDPRELDEIVRALRQLEDPRVYQNVEELARLQSSWPKASSGSSSAFAAKWTPTRTPSRCPAPTRSQRSSGSWSSSTTARSRGRRGETGVSQGETRLVIAAGRCIVCMAGAAAAQFAAVDSAASAAGILRGSQGRHLRPRLQFLPRASTPARAPKPAVGVGYRLSRRRSEFLHPPVGADQTRVSKDRDGRPDYLTVRLTDAALFQCPYLHMEDVGTVDIQRARGRGAARVPAQGRVPVGGRLLGHRRRGTSGRRRSRACCRRRNIRFRTFRAITR